MGSAPFASRAESRHGVANITLWGELDMSTVPLLQSQLRVYEGDGVVAIILDLRGLTFIDSAAVHAFEDARERAWTNQQQLVLFGARANAQRVFELTGKRSLLDDEHDAAVFGRFTDAGPLVGATDV